jgi:hypothetical protein
LHYEWLALCGSGTATFKIDGQTISSASYSNPCTCSPGKRTLNITTPAVLATIRNHANHTFTANIAGYLAWTGHCYLSYSTAQTYVDAAVACISVGAYLAVPTTSTENSVVRSIGFSQPWIGIHDIAYEQNTSGLTFQTITRESIGFNGWNPGEPNQQGDEDCVQMYATGVWNDLSCGTALPYICEFSSGVSICGNNVLEGSENCDDGNLVARRWLQRQL